VWRISARRYKLLQRDMTASTLRQAVDSATSDEAALARVILMHDRVRSTPEADKAADLIQKLLA
jgi:UDP:flavonoid glycosyltransferase YjiC (YdhE family)